MHLYIYVLYRLKEIHYCNNFLFIMLCHYKMRRLRFLTLTKMYLLSEKFQSYIT